MWLRQARNRPLFPTYPLERRRHHNTQDAHHTPWITKAAKPAAAFLWLPADSLTPWCEPPTPRQWFHQWSRPIQNSNMPINNDDCAWNGGFRWTQKRATTAPKIWLAQATSNAPTGDFRCTKLMTDCAWLAASEWWLRLTGDFRVIAPNWRLPNDCLKSEDFRWRELWSGKY